MSESDPVDEERGAARDEGGVRRMTQQSARRRHAAASAEHRHCAAACADPIAVAIRHFTATPPDTLAARVAPSPRFSRPPRPPRSLFPPRHASLSALSQPMRTLSDSSYTLARTKLLRPSCFTGHPTAPRLAHRARSLVAHRADARRALP